MNILKYQESDIVYLTKQPFSFLECPLVWEKCVVIIVQALNIETLILLSPWPNGGPSTKQVSLWRTELLMATNMDIVGFLLFFSGH